MKKVLAIHDLSCVGKCSLTVALPILSSFGIECVCLPTGIYSSHTAIPGFVSLDLTDHMQNVINAWDTLDLKFDAIYSGYLASERQIDIVEKLQEKYKCYTIIDPVMGDNGKLYSGFDDKFVSSMKRLVSKADLIFPNITEAMMLASVPYKEPPYSTEFLKDLVNKLANLGVKDVIITGVKQDDKIGIVLGSKDDADCFFHTAISGDYHGTGDIFASTVVAGFLNGANLQDACVNAAGFVTSSIKVTKDHSFKSIEFEKILAGQSDL